jgi:hypothetical protein
MQCGGKCFEVFLWCEHWTWVNITTKWKTILPKWSTNSCFKLWKLLSSRVRYIFTFHLFGLQSSMHLGFYSFYSLVLCFCFELWFIVLCLCCVLHLCIIVLLCFVFVCLWCVRTLCINWTMKCKSLESIVRSITKLKLALVWYFVGSRNTLNAKHLCLMCNSMPLPFDGDNSLNLIHPKSHVLTTNVISPYHLLSCFFVMGLLTFLFLLNYFSSNSFWLAFWCNPFVSNLCPT